MEVENSHPGMTLRFNPIDVSIVVDNLVSNARRARATAVKFAISPLERSGLQMRVSDNGRGIGPATDRNRIFDMGYTTTQGSGLGLYHVRQVLGEMGAASNSKIVRLVEEPPSSSKSLPGRRPK